MRFTLRFALFVLLLIFTINIALAKVYKPQLKANATVRIEKEWNLEGMTITLPDGVILNFSKTGRITNGHLVGSNTQLKGSNENIFDNMKISGTWNVPEISSKMFTSLAYDNALRNVFALTNQKVNNKVFIAPGAYTIVLNKSDNVGLDVLSNTDVELNGTIKLKGNDLRACDIVRISGKNIKFIGTGSILGDRNSHIDKGGEWGMGLNVDGSENVLIKGLTITDCWGDCIYVGNKSNKVIIDGCTLKRGRRQGISITSARTVTISNTKILDISGTLPEFAIDIEPNSNDTVKYVKIKNISIDNCKGGITCYGKASGSNIGTIEVIDCRVTGSVRYYSYRFRHLDKIAMRNCIADIEGDKTILIQYAKIVETSNVKVNGKTNTFKLQHCSKVVQK